MQNKQLSIKYMGKYLLVTQYALETGVKPFLSGGLLSSDRGLLFPLLKRMASEPSEESMPLSKARIPASHKVEKKEKVTDFMEG